MSSSCRPNDWATPPSPPDCPNSSHAPHSLLSTKPTASATGVSTSAPTTSDSHALCSPLPTPLCSPPLPQLISASQKMSDSSWVPIPPYSAAHSHAPHSDCQSSPDSQPLNVTPGSPMPSASCPVPVSSTPSQSPKPNALPPSCSSPTSMSPPTPDKWKQTTDCSSNSSCETTN